MRVRDQVRDKVKVRGLNLPLLLHTQIGITNLLVFLKDTGICTRMWHTQRLEEERERSGDEEEGEEEVT